MAPSTTDSIKAVILSSPLNLLLVFIPIGWALHLATTNQVATFVGNFLALVPLAKLLAWSTEELAERVGQTCGGLLNATLGNAVELIVAIIALCHCNITIVQSSLVGSILSNLLLVLGMSFFAGGTRYSEQEFLIVPSQINSELLILSVIAILIPGVFNLAVRASSTGDGALSSAASESMLGPSILKLSHGIAVILLFIYGCNLFFTLRTHAEIVNGRSPDSMPYPPGVRGLAYYVMAGLKRLRSRNSSQDALPQLDENGPDLLSMEELSPSQDLGNGQPEQEHQAQVALTPLEDQSGAERGEANPAPVSGQREEVELQMNLLVTVCLLVLVTVLVGVTAEFLLQSIDGVTATGYISEEWVGLILLPIVGNAAEHATAVTVAFKDKLNLSIAVAVGSSIQIGMFVIPFIVVISWCMGRPLTMLFDPFESVVLFLAVLTANYCVQDSKSNWFEGMILMMLYVILALAFWFYPGSNPAAMLNLSC